MNNPGVYIVPNMIYSKNEYLTNIASSLKHAGRNVESGSLSNAFLSDSSYRWVILNWIDDLNGASLSANISYVAKKLFALLLLKIRRKRICYVVHNTVGHDCRYPRLSTSWRKAICRLADSIVYLSDLTLDVVKPQIGSRLFGKIKKKMYKVPIPVYSSSCCSSRRSDAFVVLYFGLIRKYKKVENVIESAKYFQDKGLNAEFHIIGLCEDEQYRSVLKDLSSGLTNLQIEFRYCSDEELNHLISESSVVFAPFDIQNTLNSSTVIRAYQCGASVVCPRIGTTDEYPRELQYCYASDSDDDVSQALSALLRAYSDWELDSEAFYDRGESLRRIVETSNSSEIVSCSLVRALCNR